MWTGRLFLVDFRSKHFTPTDPIRPMMYNVSLRLFMAAKTILAILELFLFLPYDVKR